MARRKPDPDQQVLPFSAQVNERLAEIRSLENHLSDLGWHPDRARGVIELLERIVLCSTDGETSRARVSALAARIQSRHTVNETTIRRWRRDAESLGLLATDHPSQKYGGHRTNIWRINRVRLRELVGPGVGRAWTGHGPGVMPAPRPGTVAGPGAGVAPAPYVSREKEDPTVPDRYRAGHGAEEDTILAESERDTRAEREPPDEDRLRNELVTDHWLLRDAHQRRVAKLPPGDLVGNVFAVLDTRPDECLSNGSLVVWFRRQLGVRFPLTCDTEADLLLVLAAGLEAAAMPAAQVRKTRRRVFCAMISRRAWRSCSFRVTKARELLDRVLATHPEALIHPEGLGPRADQVTEVT